MGKRNSKDEKTKPQLQNTPKTKRIQINVLPMPMSSVKTIDDTKQCFKS